MLMKRSSPVLLLACALTVTAQPVRAWDATGHEVIARIAWDAMTPETRAKAVALLAAAPPDADLASLLPVDSRPQAVRERQLFELAATWPDIVRDKNVPARYEKYHHGKWHYINHFWEQGPHGAPRDRTDLSPDPENVVERLHHFERSLGETSRPAAERAVDLAWVLHLVGDIHQPLHTSARVTADAPRGDEGGNLVKITDQESLHWYWDQLVSKRFQKRASESQEAYVERVARTFERRFPAASQRSKLEAGRFEDWVAAGYATSKSIVYRGVVPGREPGRSYRRRAFRTVEPRIALAGYRLAEFLQNHLESLEHRMSGEGTLGGAGVAVGLAEGLRVGPGGEGVAGGPGGVRDEEGEPVLRLAAQQVEGLEAGDLVEVAVALPPHLLEALFEPGVDLETVHGDVHRFSLQSSSRPFSPIQVLLSFER
jgi:hypothetical protein